MAMERESLLIIDKSFDTLMQEVAEGLENTQVNNVGPGSVTRLIMAAINSKIADFYSTFRIEHAQAFLSKSSGRSLELIGGVLNCTRYPGESDNDYKYRISQQSLVLEKANETAVRLSALSADNVVDVVLREFTHGTGSFSVYVITDEPEVPESVIINVKDKLKDVRSFGVRAEVMKPRLAPVELRARLAFDKQMTEIDRTIVLSQATSLIRTYIQSLMPGAVLSVNTLSKEIIGLNPGIVGVEFYHFTIKGRSMIPVDQKSAWNERFTESLTAGAISVS